MDSVSVALPNSWPSSDRPALAIPGLVVLAGGENSRLQPLSTSIYKAFLPIHGISYAARHVLQAHLSGVAEVVIISDDYDPFIGRLIPYLRHAGRVQYRTVRGSQAAKILSAASSYSSWTPLLVCLGDTLARVDLQALLLRASKPDVDSAVCVAHYRLPFGVVHTEGSKVTSFQEKPVAEYLVNTGYMALGPRFLDSLHRSGDLARTLEELASTGEVGLSEVVEQFLPLDSIFDLAAAHEHLRGRGSHGGF